MCCLGTWKQGAPPAGLLSLGYGTPACPCSPKRQAFWPRLGSLLLGALPCSPPWARWVGSAVSSPPRVCLCPRTALPQGCHQFIPAGLHTQVCPSEAFSPAQGDSHQHTGICHPTLQPGTPYLHLEHLHHALEPAWLCPGQQSQRGCSTVMCRSHTEPCRKGHHVQVPRGPCPALWCCWVTGTQLSHWHGVGSSRREGATPEHLLQAKVTGVLMVPSVQPQSALLTYFRWSRLISFL